MSRGPHDQQTPEQRAAVEQDGRILQAEMDRTGFGFYSAPTQTGGWMCGWIRVDRTIHVAPSPIANTWGSDTIYDAPNAQAEILGYGYMGLGFFPPEQVAAPDFDPRAMSVERYGCDVFVDQSCQPPATILGNGEEPTYRTE